MKIKTLIPIFCILLLTALWTTGVFAKSFKNVFLAIPKASSQGTITEETESTLLITLEASSSVRVLVGEVQHTARLIKTNHLYPSVTGASILSGSFFTKDMEERMTKTAVLNEKAAFDIYGSTEVSGNRFLVGSDTYTVIGILDDKNHKEAVVYMLAETLTGNSFAVSMDGITEGIVKSTLEDNGITSLAYDYINVEQLSQLIVKKTVIALKIVLCIMLFWLLQKINSKLSASVQNTLTALWIGFDIYVAQNIMYDCLVWADSPKLKAISGENFYIIMERLQALWLWSNIFFILFIGLAVLFVAVHKKTS